MNCECRIDDVRVGYYPTSCLEMISIELVGKVVLYLSFMIIT